MEGQLVEAHSFPAQRYAESFFQKVPLDSRFLQCTYQKFMPSSSIDGRTIEFCLDRYGLLIINSNFVIFLILLNF